MEAHKDDQKLADAKASVKISNYYCELCEKSLSMGKNTKMTEIDKHVAEGEHVKAVKSS